MKKLSVSLFAVLAITLAITSAFTSQTEKKLTNRYAVVGVTPDVVSSSPSVSAIESNIGTSQSIQEVLYDNNTDISLNTESALATWLQTNFKTVGSDQYKLVCAPDADNVCAAYIDRTADQVKSFKIGDSAFELQ